MENFWPVLASAAGIIMLLLMILAYRAGRHSTQQRSYERGQKFGYRLGFDQGVQHMLDQAQQHLDEHPDMRITYGGSKPKRDPDYSERNYQRYLEWRAGRD